MLSYYAPGDIEDARYRRIGVRTAAPGVELRYRHGYFAQSADPPRRIPHVDRDTTVTLTLSDTQHEALLASGLTSTRHVDVAEETARIVVVAGDASSGTVGSVFVAADKVRNAR